MTPSVRRAATSWSCVMRTIVCDSSDGLHHQARFRAFRVEFPVGSSASRIEGPWTGSGGDSLLLRRAPSAGEGASTKLRAGQKRKASQRSPRTAAPRKSSWSRRFPSTVSVEKVEPLEDEPDLPSPDPVARRPKAWSSFPRSGCFEVGARSPRAWRSTSASRRTHDGDEFPFPTFKLPAGA
jgi:hypothetical protein